MKREDFCGLQYKIVTVHAATEAEKFMRNSYHCLDSPFVVWLSKLTDCLTVCCVYSTIQVGHLSDRLNCLSDFIDSLSGHLHLYVWMSTLCDRLSRNVIYQL